MPDITVSVIIKRTELGFVDLELEESNASRVVSLGPGQRTMRSSWSQSPHASGEYPTAQVIENQRAVIKVRLQGPNELTLNARIKALYEAVGQFSYEIHVNLDGSGPMVWQCYSADVEVGEGGVLEQAFYLEYYQNVTLNIPRLPIPSTGDF